jgi:ferrochelatase
MTGPIGVTLLNLGGPTQDAEVEGFLRRLLSDPRVLPVPWPLRPWLARRIARRRAPVVAGHYRKIGGSPLPSESLAQAEALEKELGELGEAYRVRHVFRHSPPWADRVLEEFSAGGVRRLIALPAYPQFSQSTTGSALADLSRVVRRHKLELVAIRSYPDAPGFISALADRTAPLAEGSYLLFSAHGLPASMVKKGDPYTREVDRTVRALSRALGEDRPSSLAFQSRLGKTEWTRPYLVDEIERLGKEGIRSLTVVPLSFACENLETRYELDIELAELAGENGIGSFRRVPAPGCHPDFIRELARLVRDRTEEAGWGRDGQ